MAAAPLSVEAAVERWRRLLDLERRAEEEELRSAM
jgi:hypothetical protein